MLYMIGFTNYASLDEALKVWQTTRELAALRPEQDGTATITRLAEEPVQAGQHHFDICGCMLNVTRG